MGYNIAMNWLLAKWAWMPLHSVLDIETHSRFHGMASLIDDQFFKQNDYSTFTAVIEATVTSVLVLVAPFFFFSLRFVSERHLFEWSVARAHTLHARSPPEALS